MSSAASAESTDPDRGSAGAHPLEARVGTWLLVAGLLSSACAHGTAARTAHANLFFVIGDDGAPGYVVQGKRYHGARFDVLTERVLTALQAAGVSEVFFWSDWKIPFDGGCADYRRFRDHGIEIKAMRTPLAIQPGWRVWRDLAQTCPTGEGPLADEVHERE